MCFSRGFAFGTGSPKSRFREGMEIVHEYEGGVPTDVDADDDLVEKAGEQLFVDKYGRLVH